MTDEIDRPLAGSACVTGITVAPGIRLFHDAVEHPPIFAGQTGDALRFETGPTDGTYLSFVADLALEIAEEIRAGVFLVIDLDASAEPAVPAHVRAHFTNGEASEVLNDIIVVKEGVRTVRFNLDGLRIPLELAMTVWVDVIFADPAETVLEFRNLTLSIEEQ